MTIIVWKGGLIMGELRFRHSLANSRLRNIAIEKIRYFSSMELSFEWTEDELILIYSSEMSITDVQKLEEMTKIFLESNQKIDRFFLKESHISTNSSERRKYYVKWIREHLGDLFNDIQNSKITDEGKILTDIGVPMYSNEVIKFKKNINLMISEFATYHFNALTYETPTFLSQENAKKAGYFNTGSQHMYFVSEVKKDLENFGNYYDHISSGKLKDVSDYLCDSGFVLTPAVCLHVYPILSDTEIVNSPEIPYRVYDVLGLAYRDEGNNFNESDRFREFQVHELVFFGEESSLESLERKATDFLLAIFDCLNIAGELEVANDIFFGNQEKNLLVKQILSNDKIEFVGLKSGKSLASINRHQDKFTSNFNIKSNHGKLVSMCLGFGIDRIINELLLSKGGL